MRPEGRGSTGFCVTRSADARASSPWHRPLRLALWLALGTAALALLGAPSAQADEWAITPSEPAPGATIPATAAGSSSEQTFQFQGPVPSGYLDSVSVTVWNQNPSTPGNLFPADARVGYFPVSQSPVDPTVFRGKTDGTWRWTPGTYYWQAVAEVYQTTPSVRFYADVSPVFTFTVSVANGESAPTPNETLPTLTLSESYAAVKTIIRRKTGSSAHHLSDKCLRESEAEVVCKVGWFSTAHVSSRTLLYAGTFNLEGSLEGISFSFFGLRERYGCARRYGSKRCSSRVHWG